MACHKGPLLTTATMLGCQCSRTAKWTMPRHQPELHAANGHALATGVFPMLPTTLRRRGL